MNRKQLASLLVLVLIVGGVSLAVYKKTSSTWDGTTSSGKVLGDFDLNNVARVVIQSGTSSLTLSKKNDVWVVRDRDDYPADFVRVGGFIQGLWQLKPIEDVQAGPSQLGRLDLLPPDKGSTETATLIELQDKDSKPVAALLAGKKFLKKSPQMPDDQGFPAGRYVMPADAKPPKVSLISETLDQADSNPVVWLDKTFLRIDRIQSVTLANGSNSWKLCRDNDTASDWKLAGLKPGENLDSAKVPAFAAILGSPGFTDVLAADAKRGAFDSTVSIETFDHFTYTLKFGKPDGNNLPMTVAVTADLAKERTPGKDEKPEDKKRLDDEFANTSKRLAETLAKAKALEARVYLISKLAFDPLFTPRSELLASKPAATSTPPPRPTSVPLAASRTLPTTVTTRPVAAPVPQDSSAKK